MNDKGGNILEIEWYIERLQRDYGKIMEMMHEIILNEQIEMYKDISRLENRQNLSFVLECQAVGEDILNNDL